MIPFNIKQLETFLWVATLGSFRKAADRLNTTQPAISSRIAGLEEALGVKLFERQSSTVRLTEKGQQLLPPARRVLRMADRMRLKAKSLAGETGVLRLGVAETIVQTWLADFLREFHASLPLIEIDILVDVTPNLRNELMSQQIDLALLMGPVLEHRIENLELCSFPLVWVGSPRLGLMERSRLALHDLAQYPIITHGRETPPCCEIYRKLSSEFDDVPRMFSANSLAATIKLAADGVGIASLPRDLVREHVDSGRLRVFDCEWHPSDLQFTASYPLEPSNPSAEQAALMAARIAKGYAAGRSSRLQPGAAEPHPAAVAGR